MNYSTKNGHFIHTLGALVVFASQSHSRLTKVSLNLDQHHMGYPFGTKGYNVLNLPTKRMHVSRDVLFHKNIFLFGLKLNFDNLSSCFDVSSFPLPQMHLNVENNVSTDLSSNDFVTSSTASPHSHNIVSPIPVSGHYDSGGHHDITEHGIPFPQL